jgi:hypothetical protein
MIQQCRFVLFLFLDELWSPTGAIAIPLLFLCDSYWGGGLGVFYLFFGDFGRSFCGCFRSRISWREIVLIAAIGILEQNFNKFSQF